MTEHSIRESIGLAEKDPIKVAGIKYKVTFVVINTTRSYNMLLGRPWLRMTGTIHDWGTNEIMIQVGKAQITVSTTRSGKEKGDGKLQEQIRIRKKNYSPRTTGTKS